MRISRRRTLALLPPPGRACVWAMSSRAALRRRGSRPSFAGGRDGRFTVSGFPTSSIRRSGVLVDSAPERTRYRRGRSGAVEYRVRTDSAPVEPSTTRGGRRRAVVAGAVVDVIGRDALRLPFRA